MAVPDICVLFRDDFCQGVYGVTMKEAIRRRDLFVTIEYARIIVHQEISVRR